MVSEMAVNVCSGPPSAIVLKSSSIANARHCHGELGKKTVKLENNRSTRVVNQRGTTLIT